MSHSSDRPEVRIGIGYDVHATAPGRRLVLGGVDVPCPFGLVGHSDADVLTHAVCDALLGALALPDIGRQFPDTDPTYRDISSLKLLDRVMELVRAEGYEVGNVDCVVIAQEPKLAPFVDEMRARLAERLDVAPNCVGVKATTTERLGFEGQQQGIAAQAAVVLRRRAEQDYP